MLLTPADGTAGRNTLPELGRRETKHRERNNRWRSPGESSAEPRTAPRSPGHPLLPPRDLPASVPLGSQVTTKTVSRFPLATMDFGAAQHVHAPSRLLLLRLVSWCLPRTEAAWWFGERGDGDAARAERAGRRFWSLSPSEDGLPPNSHQVSPAGSLWTTSSPQRTHCDFRQQNAEDAFGDSYSCLQRDRVPSRVSGGLCCVRSLPACRQPQHTIIHH